MNADMYGCQKYEVQFVVYYAPELPSNKSCYLSMKTLSCKIAPWRTHQRSMHAQIISPSPHEFPLVVISYSTLPFSAVMGVQRNCNMCKDSLSPMCLCLGIHPCHVRPTPSVLN
ncbi:hypothetical protein Pelo_18127 [Pelomyxa schiedti]|nr:hypothetical protein Pelo_18127 [Pelomyxa schiedti]